MRNQRLRILNPDLIDQYYQNENYTEIANFIKKHVLSVGKEQAVKDFQCGLNFLHKDLTEPLKEDGDLPSFSAELKRSLKNGLTDKSIIYAA